jgi:hypothetical protein
MNQRTTRLGKYFYHAFLFLQITFRLTGPVLYAGSEWSRWLNEAANAAEKAKNSV